MQLGVQGVSLSPCPWKCPDKSLRTGVCPSKQPRLFARAVVWETQCLPLRFECFSVTATQAWRPFALQRLPLSAHRKHAIGVAVNAAAKVISQRGGSHRGGRRTAAVISHSAHWMSPLTTTPEQLNRFPELQADSHHAIQNEGTYSFYRIYITRTHYNRIR